MNIPLVLKRIILKRSAWFISLFMRPNDIVLCGGFGGKKYGDNSSVLFEYMIQHHPNVRCYWVINKDSPDIKSIANNKQILHINSFKANLYALLAKVHICSHGSGDLGTYKAKYYTHSYKIFLGHGVDALKKYRSWKDVHINDMFDLFTAVSEWEQTVQIEVQGIDMSKIFVSGMPRYDSLLRLNSQLEDIGQKQVLYMPTWRDWLQAGSKNDVEQFGKIIQRFVTDTKLLDALKKNNVILKLGIHVNMQNEYYETLKDVQNSVVSIMTNNTDLQAEITKSDLYITDYSSIAFDFLYLNKLTIFYQFDYDKYISSRGSYIDMKNDLFGPVFYEQSSAIDELVKIISNGFQIREYQCKLDTARKLYFKYFDDDNCERVVDEIVRRRPDLRFLNS